MPTTPDTLDAAIARVAVHEHLCLIYESRAEQFAAVVPFVRCGLAAGERCVYIADDNTSDEVVAALQDSGIDTEAETARGALQILTKRESYLCGGRFDPAYAHKLFTPFESLHPPVEFSGTGVGLATVSRTLESLGGTCWAEGKPDEGATFYFVLADADGGR